MGDNMTPTHNCEQQDKFLDIASFTGKIEEAVVNMRGDINVLFDQNREILKALSNLKQDVNTIKIKFGILGVVIGIFGSGLFQIGITFLGKIIG